MSTSASTCYFCIRKIVFNESTGLKDDKYVGVVELGKLTEQQAAVAFHATTHRLVQIIERTLEEGWSIISTPETELRLLQVSECNFEETGKSDLTEYAIRFEHEADATTIIQWSSKSKSFRRSRYKDALRKLDFDLDEVDRPENDTILAAAVGTAKMVRKKLRSDGHPISSLPAESIAFLSSIFDSTGGKAKPSTIPVSAQKSELSESYWASIQRYFDQFMLYSGERTTETPNEWVSLFSSITRRIDANDPCVTSVDLKQRLSRFLRNIHWQGLRNSGILRPLRKELIQRLKPRKAIPLCRQSRCLSGHDPKQAQRSPDRNMKSS